MPINKNHEFEELDGVKCGIVEKNVNEGRVNFLKKLLTHNNYEVIVVPTPLPKVVAKPGTEIQPETNLPETIPTFTIGVTDYTFNPVNAIFGRLLKTEKGVVVTQAYWLQQTTVADDEVPYYER